MAIDLSGKKKKNEGSRVPVTVAVDGNVLMLQVSITELEECKGTLSSTGKSYVLSTFSESLILPSGKRVRLGLNITEKVG